jgi:hypothetical protein
VKAPAEHGECHDAVAQACEPTDTAETDRHGQDGQHDDLRADSNHWAKPNRPHQASVIMGKGNACDTDRAPVRFVRHPG